MKEETEGERDLKKLLGTLSPELLPERYVFCSVKDASVLADLKPFAVVREEEGITIVLTEDDAGTAGLSFDSVFRCITLRVHSSLDAVGLTAAVSGKLADRGISANIIAGFYHDHIFVPAERAEEAAAALSEFSKRTGG